MKESNFIVSCPHCQFFIIIEQINCAIFRHGVLKDTGEQINSHLDRESCENLVEQNKIFGCGKPFKIIYTENQYEAEICDYI